MESRVSVRSLIMIFILSAGMACPVAGGASLPKDSLFQVSSRWFDSKNAEFALDHFRGSPVVVSMIYPRCKFSCPLILNKLKKIEKELADKAKIKFLLISFDHKKDSPEAFREFLEEKELDPAKWVLIGGKTSGGIREIAALLDVSYKEEKNGEFSHSNVITLLDAEGVKRLTLNGLAADHAAFVKAARELP